MLVRRLQAGCPLHTSPTHARLLARATAAGAAAWTKPTAAAPPTPATRLARPRPALARHNSAVCHDDTHGQQSALTDGRLLRLSRLRPPSSTLCLAVSSSSDSAGHRHVGRDAAYLVVEPSSSIVVAPHRHLHDQTLTRSRSAPLASLPRPAQPASPFLSPLLRLPCRTTTATTRTYSSTQRTPTRDTARHTQLTSPPPPRPVLPRHLPPALLLLRRLPAARPIPSSLSSSSDYDASTPSDSYQQFAAPPADDEAQAAAIAHVDSARQDVASTRT